MDEERGHREVRKVGGAQDPGPAGWMQRVGLEQESRRQGGLGSDGAGLAKRQVTTQDGDAARDERLGYGHQQRRVGTAAGAVGEDKAVGSRRRGQVQNAANGWVAFNVNAFYIHGGASLTTSVSSTCQSPVHRGLTSSLPKRAMGCFDAT